MRPNKRICLIEHSPRRECPHWQVSRVDLSRWVIGLPSSFKVTLDGTNSKLAKLEPPIQS